MIYRLAALCRACPKCGNARVLLTIADRRGMRCYCCWQEGPDRG